jgi:hypothetical protein
MIIIFLCSHIFFYQLWIIQSIFLSPNHPYSSCNSSFLLISISQWWVCQFYFVIKPKEERKCTCKVCWYNSVFESIATTTPNLKFHGYRWCVKIAYVKNMTKHQKEKYMSKNELIWVVSDFLVKKSGNW